MARRSSSSDGAGLIAWSCASRRSSRVRPWARPAGRAVGSGTTDRSRPAPTPAGPSAGRATSRGGPDGGGPAGPGRGDSGRRIGSGGPAIASVGRGLRGEARSDPRRMDLPVARGAARQPDRTGRVGRIPPDGETGTNEPAPSSIPDADFGPGTLGPSLDTISQSRTSNPWSPARSLDPVHGGALGLRLGLMPMPRIRTTIVNTNDRKEQRRRAFRVRQDLIDNLPVYLDPDSPLEGVHSDDQRRAYFEVAADQIDAIRAVLHDRGHDGYTEVSIPERPNGEPCVNCGNIAGPKLPAVCPNCGFRDIAPCPICRRRSRPRRLPQGRGIALSNVPTRRARAPIGSGLRSMIPCSMRMGRIGSPSLSSIPRRGNEIRRRGTRGLDAAGVLRPGVHRPTTGHRQPPPSCHTTCVPRAIPTTAIS